MTTLFTIGWSKMEPAGLVELLKQHGIATLVDIRWKPYSRFRPDFNKNRLGHEGGPLLSEGIGYVHMVELGNEGKDTGTVQLVDEAVGLERLQAEMERRTGRHHVRVLRPGEMPPPRRGLAHAAAHRGSGGRAPSQGCIDRIAAVMERWSGSRDLNPGPLRPERSALPN